MHKKTHANAGFNVMLDHAPVKAGRNLDCRLQDLTITLCRLYNTVVKKQPALKFSTLIVVAVHESNVELVAKTGSHRTLPATYIGTILDRGLKYITGTYHDGKSGSYA